jgi:glycosyltransferase involved in cell wall biosynthesis
VATNGRLSRFLERPPSANSRERPRLERSANGRTERRPSVLLVSSFVLPHAGGVEQFVDTAKELFGARGLSVRVLSCRPPTGPSDADATVPTRYLPPGGWPLPVGGLRTLWREVERADSVVANGARHLLPCLASFVARIRRKRVLFVLHGSAAPFSSSSFLYHRVLGSIFEWLLARPALRLSKPVSLSRAGVTGAHRRYGVAPTYVPYPLRELPTPTTRRSLEPDEPLEIVWVGRLYREKAPLRAVAVVERIRSHREARLELYGDGVLADELEFLAADRPWLAVRGADSWHRIQEVQEAAHICLSTSLRDATQIGILEPLARGIPVVSTRVGDAPHHYVAPALRRFCVEPGDDAAAAAAILELAASYTRYRSEFVANGRRLRTRHRAGRDLLAALVEEAVRPRTTRPALGAAAGFRSAERILVP